MIKKAVSLLLVLLLVCSMVPIVVAQESEVILERVVISRSVHYVTYASQLSVRTGTPLPNDFYVSVLYDTLPDGTEVYANGTMFLQYIEYNSPPGKNTGHYKGTLLAYMPYEY